MSNILGSSICLKTVRYSDPPLIQFHVLFIPLQYNPWGVMPCCSSVSIPMQRLIHQAFMVAALWSKARSGQQPNGFTWGLSKPHHLIQQMVHVSIRTQAALCGPWEGNAKRTLSTWWALRIALDIVGRAAMSAHLEHIFWSTLLVNCKIVLSKRLYCCCVVRRTCLS